MKMPAFSGEFTNIRQFTIDSGVSCTHTNVLVIAKDKLYNGNASRMRWPLPLTGAAAGSASPSALPLPGFASGSATRLKQSRTRSLHWR